MAEDPITLSKNNAREIVILRKRSHDHANRITLNHAQLDATRDDINSIKSDINVIKENHLSHMEKDMASMKTEIEAFKQTHTDDIKWIKEKFKSIDRKTWAVIMLILGTFIAIIVK